MPHRPVYISTGRAPHQAAALAGGTALGVGIAAMDGVPASVQAGMPGPITVVWLALLILAGPAGTVGAWWRGRLDTGLRVEGAGVVALAAASTMYGVGLVAYSPTLPWITVVLVAALAVGSWWRSAEIWRDVRRLSRTRVRIAPMPTLVRDDRDAG